MEIGTFTSFPFKIRNFPLKSSLIFFFYDNFFFLVFPVKRALVVPRAARQTPASQGGGLAPSEETGNGERPVAREGARAPLTRDVRAGADGWLLGSHANLHWSWSALASISLELGLLHVMTNVCVLLKPRPIKTFPPISKKSFLKLWRDFWGGGNMGGWARRCEGLASEAPQDRGKLEKCKHGRGEKGKQIETWEESRRATLEERVSQLR